MKPYRKRILVEPIKIDDSKFNSIYIPEAHQEKQPSIECIVRELGTSGPFEVAVGDRILIERYRGDDVKVGHRLYKLVLPTEILAIIE